MSQRVAIVTGSNKGIGFAIVKGLCNRFDGVVYLTSRNEAMGIAAVKDLNDLGLKPNYHQLDVADKDSVRKFRDHIKEKHGRIDILVNNAGIVLGTGYEDCKKTIDINYGGIKNVEELLFPLLVENARVLHISSDCGHLSNVKHPEWIKRLSSKDLTRSDIDEFVNWFLNSVRDGTFKRSYIADFGSIAAYRVSKVAVSALTILQQKEVESRNICVNSVHPGLVSTDMTMGIGVLSQDESAKTPLYLVLDAPGTIKGAYVWYDGSIVDWFDHKTDYYFKTKSFIVPALKKYCTPLIVVIIAILFVYSFRIRIGF
ncbi:carbonyl reductase [NADPH] 1-like [Plodia interpunctella]|uniref:carbonyl reductase [NADPH] 1-like n=1 Tax=Plodia interpunctella TaxID=58824 RepID=UPI002367E65C|nr:carbonyl reductase [NADPH] 1-like [Plodia interpunctella]